MFIQKMFLLSLFIPIGLYSFSLFEEKSSSEVSVSKPIYIEPIVIPNSVKEESNSEILEKLKVATTEAFKNAEPSEDEVAKEVLGTLSVLAKSREREEQRKREQEKKKKLAKKREQAKKKLLKQKELARKKEQAKRKLAKERAYAKKKELARKKKLQEKRRVEKKRELEKKALSLSSKTEPTKIKTVKKGVLLGVQKGVYTLSKDKEKSFKNLEVVSKSKTFVLEERPKIKSPKQYQGSQPKINFDELPLVETLGVVNVSKPFLKHK